MRRALPLLAIIASTVLFLAATPNPASAANCGTYVSQATWDGTYLVYDVFIQNCTLDVDQVQFGNGTCSGCAGGPGGFYDFTWMTSINTSCNPFYTCGVHTVTFDINPPYQSHLIRAGYRALPWCFHVTHAVENWFWYRIHMLSAAWGPWHTSYSTTYNLVC